MKSLSIHGAAAIFHNVVFDFGLVVDELEVRMGQGTVRRDPFSLELGETATATATVTEASIAKVLAAKAPDNIRDFEATVAAGQIHITAKAVVLLPIPVKATCHLEIVDEKQVFVRLDSVEVLGGGAKSLVEAQIEKVNPLLDVAELSVDIKLTQIVAEDGKVVLHAEMAGQSV